VVTPSEFEKPRVEVRRARGRKRNQEKRTARAK